MQCQYRTSVEVIWVNVNPLSGYLSVRAKDPVKPHVKLGGPNVFSLSGANVPVETLDVRV